MTKYPDEAYNPVMQVYGSLPPELKPQANALMGEYAEKYPQGEAPPDQMLRDLQALASSQHSLEERIAGHGGQSNDISHKTHSVPNWMKAAAAVALFYFLGAPYFI